MKFHPHSFTRKVLHWPYCAKCGLVMLKNRSTEARIRKGCDEPD